MESGRNQRQHAEITDLPPLNGVDLADVDRAGLPDTGRGGAAIRVSRDWAPFRSPSELSSASSPHADKAPDDVAAITAEKIFP